jgi:hypothetical protein
VREEGTVAREPKEIKALIGRFEEEEALEELRAIGEQAVPQVRRALGTLEPHDTVTAEWLLRILEATAGDFLGQTLGWLKGAHYQLAEPGRWALHRAAKDGDRPRLRGELAKASGFRKSALPKGFDFYDLEGQACILCETLARLGDQESVPVLEHLFGAASAKLEDLGKKGGSAYEMFYRDCGPAASAAAAGLLSLSEQAGRDDEPRRKLWRETCAAVAQDANLNYGFNVLTLPMPFLFAGSPVEASRVTVLLLQGARDLDQTLRYMGAWITEAGEHGVAVALDPSVEGISDLTEMLGEFVEGMADSYIDWSCANPGAPLKVMGAAAPGRAEEKALTLLWNGPIGTDFVADAARQIREGRKFESVAAIAVEAVLSGRKESGSFRTLQEGDEEDLNEALAKAGFAQVKGWAWKAPEGSWGDLHTVEGLEGALRAISVVLRRFDGTTSAECARILLEPLRECPGHELVTHALHRNALLALSRASKAGKEALSGLLGKKLSEEREPAMVQAVLYMAKEILKDEAGTVDPWLLGAPAVRDNPGLAARVVEAVRGRPNEAARAPLLALKEAAGKAGADRKLRDLIGEALLALGEPDEIGALAEKIEKGGQFISGFEEMTLLRLAALHPGRVREGLYGKLLAGVLSSGHGAYSGWEEAIAGPQLRGYFVGRLGDPAASEKTVAEIAEFIKWAGFTKAELPARALPLLLARLPEAVLSAKSNPGEEWEDRNWGGYNQTGQETYAEALGEAVLALAGATFPKEEWGALLEGVLGLEGVDLSSVETGGGSGYSYGYKTVNLLATLRDNLRRLRDPALEPLLAGKPGRESLAAVLEELKK